MPSERLDFSHANRFILQFEHLQKEPSIMPKEEFLMTVVGITELSWVPERFRNLLGEYR